ncbi:TPA: ABC transporter permease [Candidatus Bipolaricaulota bacterium]|nr:ABC transporter permease [Candidatus Bipolaricaulota bacterium]
MAIRIRKRIKEHFKAFRTATRLGWQIESNWTDPLVFAIYSIVKPVAAFLILVVMYLVITQGRTGTELFWYIFVGNGFYIFVGNVLFGISWAILDDREHYEMLKYIYLSPIQIYIYLLGRGMAQLLVSSISVAITLAFGALLLGVPLGLLRIDYPLLFTGLFFGLGGIVALGIILAGICLVIARHSWGISESVAGAFYLLCGVVFPLDVLPRWARTIGLALPPTYWLELMRRAVLGGKVEGVSQILGRFSDGSLLLILLGTTAGLMLVSHLSFKSAERRARREGLIDQQTHY